MPIKYTEQEIDALWQEVRAGDPDMIYHEGARIFNYMGNLRGGTEPYTECVSRMLLRDFGVLTTIGRDLSKVRNRGFNQRHNGVSRDERRQQRDGKTSFNERPFAVALFNSGRDYPFGRIFDYEVPLRPSRAVKIGEIDLVAVLAREVTAVELKIGSSEAGETKETLLRAIMEAYTFCTLLNLRQDLFALEFKLVAILLRPAVLTVGDSLCRKHMEMLASGRFPELTKLLARINTDLAERRILPFKFFAMQADRPELTKDARGRTVVASPAFFDAPVLEHFDPLIMAS
jgi:hypothetical protein